MEKRAQPNQEYVKRFEMLDVSEMTTAVSISKLLNDKISPDFSMFLPEFDYLVRMTKKYPHNVPALNRKQFIYECFKKAKVDPEILKKDIAL